MLVKGGKRMADYCFKCWNKLNSGDCRRGDYVLSKEEDICEGCGEYKQVVEFKIRGNFFSFFHVQLVNRIKRKK